MNTSHPAISMADATFDRPYLVKTNGGFKAKTTIQLEDITQPKNDFSSQRLTTCT